MVLGVRPFPRDSPSSRGAALVTLCRRARSPSTGPRSLSPLRRLMDPPTREGSLPAPHLRPACVGLSRLRLNGPESAATGTITKKGQAKSGSNPGRTVPALSPTSGSLQPEGFPPLHDSAHPTATGLVGSPMTAFCGACSTGPHPPTPLAVGCLPPVEGLVRQSRVAGSPLAYPARRAHPHP